MEFLKVGVKVKENPAGRVEIVVTKNVIFGVTNVNN
jgi:hypothetical protein